MDATAGRHRYPKAGAALAAASVAAAAAIAPVTPLPSAASVVERAVRLAADDVVDMGLLNVPLNLFQDVFNIGANEIVAENALSKSLLYATNFFVPSATNIFGTDPGDLLHYPSLTTGFFFPFSRDISGVGSPVIDPEAMANGTAPLGQQIALLVAAETPTSPSSDADWSSPIAPATPITGFTPIDRFIWGAESFTGGQPYPILDNWFKVPLSDLMGGNFKFDLTTDPEGLVMPSMGTGVNGSVPDDDVFGGIGTITAEQAAARGVAFTDAAGEPITTNAAGNPINFMPWTGLDFKFDPAAPFQQYFASLMDPVDMSFHYGLPADLPNGVAAPLDGFVVPSLDDVGQAMRALQAGSVIAFDPFTAGSPFCSGPCITDGFPDIVNMVKAIDQGNNPLIDHWLDLVNTPSPDVGNPNPNLDMTGAQTGSINWATPHQINSLTAFLQGDQNMFDFGNPSPLNPPIDGTFGVDTPEDVITPTGFPIAPQIQDLIDLMKASGVQAFFHDLANIAGYTPLDYGSDVGDAGATSSTESLSQLLTDPGLADLF